MAKRLKRGQERWVPQAEYNPEWVHARLNGCGGFPRSSNMDRVTCPACITPPSHNVTTEVSDDE